MNSRIRHRPRREQGMVLIISLLLLLVITILALAMFRGVGLEGRIAGNVMDKERALQAATTTEDYAEQWLVDNVATSTPTSCTPTSFAGLTAPIICSNTLAASTTYGSAVDVPWDMGGTNNATDALGYDYNPSITPTSTLFLVSTGVPNDYVQAPTVYIANLGTDATLANAVDYQVDAWSYGGSTGTVSVVESVYQIRYIAMGGGGP